MSRLHHIALGAHNVERVAHFYRDQLGLTEIKRHFTQEGRLRSIWLDLGGAILMVEATSAAPHRVEGIGHGPFIVVVQIEESERLLWENRLVMAGFAIEDRTTYTSYTRDPEGNRVGFSFYPLPG